MFKQKFDGCGEIEKYKCRLVAQSSQRVRGVYYEEPSSPASAQTSIRIILGIVEVLGWEVRQLDMYMAYLEAEMKEDIYIELPDGYRVFNNRLDASKRPCMTSLTQE